MHGGQARGGKLGLSMQVGGGEEEDGRLNRGVTGQNMRVEGGQTGRGGMWGGGVGG